MCLIQMSVGDVPYIIDPLYVDDMEPLGEILDSHRVIKILHAGDYDIRSLHRDYGFVFQNVFDTSIAAALMGSKRLGLDAILMEYIQVEVSKEKRLQRSDWTLRPLSDEALGYAADDVRYLGKAREKMTRKLEDLGRQDWVKEECHRLCSVRFEPREEATAFLNLKGSGDLDGHALALLKRLYDLREDEAIGKDRPPFKIVSDSVLISIAREPDCEYAELRGIGWWARPSMVKRIKVLVKESRKDEPIVRPKRKKIPASERLSNRDRERANKRLKQLKLWRSGLGENLEVDPSLLWPTSSLSRLAKDPSTLSQEFESNDVRGWQIEEFSNKLETFVKELITKVS
ncbi:MAG TPA: hypothetical protein DEP04_06185 [Dehalococcoidia bacterium]|nr:hypothetical protein [Dehalococcoidia bacterium]